MVHKSFIENEILETLSFVLFLHLVYNNTCITSTKSTLYILFFIVLDMGCRWKHLAVKSLVKSLQLVLFPLYPPSHLSTLIPTMQDQTPGWPLARLPKAASPPVRRGAYLRPSLWWQCVQIMLPTCALIGLGGRSGRSTILTFVL